MDRIPAIEKVQYDHARTLTAHNDLIGRMDLRLIALEIDDRARKIQDAVAAERDIATKEWRERVESRFDRIEGLGRKIVGLVGGGILMAVVAFLVKGEFFTG